MVPESIGTWLLKDRDHRDDPMCGSEVEHRLVCEGVSDRLHGICYKPMGRVLLVYRTKGRRKPTHREIHAQKIHACPSTRG